MPSHTYANLVGQSYTVTLTASNFCCSDTYVMTVGNASSTTPSFTEVCHLYPNPANGKIVVELKNSANAKVSIQDMTGKVLVSENIQSEKTIDLSNFGAGVYLLRLEAEGNTYLTKIINQ
jgi:PKD repeat protein